MPGHAIIGVHVELAFHIGGFGHSVLCLYRLTPRMACNISSSL